MSAPGPSGVDFEEFLLGAGLVVTEGKQEEWERHIRVESKIRAATELFLSRTDRTFGLVQKTLSFDIPRNKTVNVGVDFRSVVSLTIGGTALVENTDFWLKPYDAPLKDKPFNRIELSPPWINTGVPYARQINKAIVAVLMVGYSAGMPERAKQAILLKTAATAAPQLSLAISRGLLTWTSPEGRREEYSHYAGQIPLSTERKMWLEDYAEIEGDFIRTTVF